MPKRINIESFLPYGRVIEYARKKPRGGKKNIFCVILKEPRPLGWRIAYLIVRDKAINKLEQHLDSYESFEPIRGKSLLYLAHPRNPTKIECFFLDKPVILNKGIWHGVVALSAESEIKITENAQVKCIYRRIPSLKF